MMTLQQKLARPSLWLTLQKKWYQTRLKTPEFAFLFESAPDDDWVCFDCETTGLRPGKDQIISLAAVKIRGHEILHGSRLELIIKQNGPINPASITIHQILDKETMQGMSAQEALYQFLEFVGSRPLVGYFVEFDVAMMNQLAVQYLGIRLTNTRIDVSGLYYDQKIGLIPQKPLDLTFNTLLKELDIPRLSQHNAYDDTLMTAMMFVKLTCQGA